MNMYNQQKNKYQANKNTNASNWTSRFKKDWITRKLDKAAIDFAENFGKYIADKLSTSQIRNFFGEVRRIQMRGIEKEKTAFLLLKPKLAYAAKRKGGIGAENFKKIMEQAHNAVIEVENNDEEFKKRFKNYVDFLEAILAFHKAYGRKQIKNF